MRRSAVAVSAVLAFSSACTPERSYDEYSALIRAANEELLNKGNVESATEFFAPRYLLHTTGPDVSGGPEVIQGFVTGLRAAFPDLQVEIEVLVVDDDKVAWMRRHRGTHNGDFMGVPASGRVIEWQDMVVTRYDGDKIAEEWGLSTLGERLRTQ